MNLKPYFAPVLALGTLALAVQTASAAVVSLSPAAQNVTLGSSTTVDVRISDLVPGGAPTLTGFNFQLLYNPAVLLATGVTFGPGMDLGVNGSVNSSDVSFVPGIFSFEFSLEDFGALEAFQSLPGNIPLTLFSIDFDAVGLGTSSILEDPQASNSLSDENAENIPYSYEAASITVIPTGGPPGEVPEASTTVAALALGGLVGRFAWRRAKAVRS